MIKRSGARCCDSSMIARCNPCPCPKIMTWRTTSDPLTIGLGQADTAAEARSTITATRCGQGHPRHASGPSSLPEPAQGLCCRVVVDTEVPSDGSDADAALTHLGRVRSANARRGSNAPPGAKRNASTPAGANNSCENNHTMLISDPNEKPCTLARPEAFSNELAAKDLRRRLRPGRDPNLVEERSETASAVFASRCAGDQHPPTAAELYYAMRQTEPNERELSVLDSWVMHATVDDLWWAWTERVYSWQMLVRAMHRVGLPWWPGHRYVNAHAERQDLVAADTLPVC